MAGQRVTRLTGQDTADGRVAIVVTYAGGDGAGETSVAEALAQNWDEAYRIIDTLRQVLKRTQWGR